LRIACEWHELHFQKGHFFFGNFFSSFFFQENVLVSLKNLHAHAFFFLIFSPVAVVLFFLEFRIANITWFLISYYFHATLNSPFQTHFFATECALVGSCQVCPGATNGRAILAILCECIEKRASKCDF